MGFCLTRLFDTFSTDLAEPSYAALTGEEYLLVSVEQLIGWPIDPAMKYDTSDEFLQFLMKENIYSFGPTRMVISNNERF